MDAFLIVTAIMLSVWVLFRYAVPIGKPKISVGEVMTDDALEKRFYLLGKECAVTRRGFGMDYKRFNVKKIIGAIEKRVRSKVEPYEWEKEILFAADIFEKAHASALVGVRLCYTLGHVRGDLPRLFVLCSEIVRCTNGCVTKRAIELCAAEFEKHSPLTAAEKKFFNKMLLYCLCGYVCVVSNGAKYRTEFYRDGVSDGTVGRVDLDKLNNDWYVSGLLAGTSDCSSVMSVLENNGVSTDKAKDEVNKFYAKTIAVIRAVSRSIEAIAAEANSHAATDEIKLTKRQSAQLIALTVAPCVLTLAVGITVCVLAPHDFAAVFVVFAIIFYGCFRLPVLLNYPFISIDLFGRFAHKKSKPENPKYSRADSELAYFGGEREGASNTLLGSGIKIVCCGNGRIHLYRRGARFDRPELEISAGGRTVGLDDFFGLHAKNKTVYRLLTDDAELCTTVIASTDYPCCFFRIACINRTAQDTDFKISARLLSARRGKAAVGRYASIASETETVCVAFDNPAEYGSTVGAFAGHGYTALNGCCTIKVNPFARAECLFAVMYGACERELEQILRGAASRDFWEFAADAASVFGGEAADDIPEVCSWRTSDARDFAGAPHAEQINPDCDEHGFTDDGCFVPSSDGDVNIVTDGQIMLKCYKNTLGEVFDAECGRRIYSGENISLVFGENGVILSPFSAVCDSGSVAVFGSNITKYICNHENLRCELGVYPVRNAHAFMLDVSFTNTRDCERDIDIVVSAGCGTGSRIACGDNAVAVSGNGMFTISSELQVSEYGMREECWTVNGRPNRTRDFRSGGSAPAAVMSVNTRIPANGRSCVRFCVMYGEGKFDWGLARKSFDIPSKVTLRSDNKALNAAYSLAAYRTYINVLRGCKFDAVALCCAKYVDQSLVKKRLTEILSTQNADGSFDSANRCSVCYAVADYIMFSRDYPFLNAVLPFAECYECGKRVKRFGTVKEHCFAALDGFSAGGALTCKAGAVAFKFFGRLCGADTVRAARYRQAEIDLNRIFGDGIKRAIARGSTCFNSELDALASAVALYLGGDYVTAYAIISALTEKYISNGAFYSERDRTREFALYCTVVTELLLGIKLFGSRAKLNPRTSKNCPKIAFDITVDGKTAHIDVDNGSDSGDWRMRVDRINYAVDSIKIDGSDKTVVLYRDGG